MSSDMDKKPLIPSRFPTKRPRLHFFIHSCLRKRKIDKIMCTKNVPFLWKFILAAESRKKVAEIKGND